MALNKIVRKANSVDLFLESVYRFDEHSAKNKEDFLRQILNIKSLIPRQIKALNKGLLFTLAYPENKNLCTLASITLQHVYTLVSKLSLENKSRLSQSTLPYTQTRGYYSFSLIYWLWQQDKSCLQLAELEEGAVHPREIMKHALSEMEYELHGNEALKPLEWLQFACGSRNKKELLDFILTQLHHLDVSTAIKDQLFDAMRVGIRFVSGNAYVSSGNLKFGSEPAFTHPQGLLKKFDEKKLISAALPEPINLNQQERSRLIQTARYCLFLLNRETDPVTLCDETGLEYYSLERGFSIAFFSKNGERRLPLESYIGFMLFKNGYPAAYGGAWLFGKRSLIGINIFEAFRGGESAYLFCQLLRTYSQRFNLRYIEVEPYQFGRGNPEGIKSGAFWFYYRFGFRPIDPELEKLASEEHERIKTNKSYRSPFSVLKAFTHSNLVLNLDPAFKTLDPSVISNFITQQINSNFTGNRTHFKKWSLNKIQKDLGIEIKKLNREEKIGLEKLYAFVSVCLDTEKMNSKEKQKLKQLILEKGKSEFTYALLLEKFDLIKHIRSPELRIELGI
jgi:hypothetical protein